ncbi:MAG: apolipoprotein N-acyltransferase [Chlamydiae bacterium]|nr:apolipoprotein N-acyltransferase [Chlamydiota bacterium]
MTNLEISKARFNFKNSCIFLLAVFIVAFGQPIWSFWLGLVSSFCGYALFWQIHRQRFWYSTLFFCLVQLVQLSWMSSVEYVGAGLILGWVFFSLGLGIFFGFFSLFVKEKMSLSTILALAALWTIFERSRFFFLSGYSWNPVGLSLTGFLPFLQFASLFGILGFTFLVMSVNLLVKTKRYFLAGGSLALVFLWGCIHLLLNTPSREVVQVALIQPNIPPTAIQSFPVWQKVLPLLEKARGAELLVLPEGVLPYGYETPAFDKKNIRSAKKNSSDFVSNKDILHSISEEYNADVIAGVDADNYQAAVFISPGVEQIYGKRILLPFAEYIPFRWCASIAERFGIKASYNKGDGPLVFQGRKRCGIGICYEETFGHLVQENYELEPDFLVFIVNDAWYPNSTLGRQHFFHARLRGVELGLSMVRASTNGVTAALDGHGRLIGALPENQAGVLNIAVPICHFPTLYAYLGDTPMIILCFLCIGFKIITLIKSRRQWRNPLVGLRKKH